MKSSKTILVAGGAGFIGSHLCRSLLERGNRVLCLDNLLTGAKQNISDLINNSSFEFIEHDITERFCADESIDQIYNLACPASPVQYQRYPLETSRTCFVGTENLLQLAQHSGARILQASTSEVYGSPTVHPQPESYFGNVNTVGIRSCYDEGKRIAETLFADYRRVRGVDSVIVRIFNTYGPAMQPNDGRVISNFIVQALTGKDLTIYGQGDQTRSFCYVSDMVEGLMMCMDAGNCVAGPMNIGNPEEYSIIEIAELINQMTGGLASITHKDLPQDDPQRRKPDISLIKATLDWSPSIDLPTGLKPTIEYFRRQLGC